MKRSDSRSVSHFCDQVAGIWDHARAWSAALWMSDKMSFTWPHIKTLFWPLMSGALDLRDSLISPHHTHRTGLYRTVCDLGDAPPPRLLKLWSSMRKEVLDQWSGWHIHWQARYYSSATVPQIVFQVVRNLPSHPQGVYVTGARGSICLPSV